MKSKLVDGNGICLQVTAVPSAYMKSLLTWANRYALRVVAN